MCLALLQERIGNGKPACLDMGTAREAVADGHAGVCVLAQSADQPVGGAAELALTHLVSSDRQTEPRGCGSALPLAFSAQSPVASLSSVTRHAEIKFGMTHVSPRGAGYARASWRKGIFGRRCLPKLLFA